MSYYEVLLFLHVLAAIVWIGAGIALQFLGVWGEQTQNGPFMQALGDSSDWLATRLFIPSSLAVLVLGILLTIEGPWTFDTLWLDLGFAGFAVSFLTGILFLKPEGERIGRAIAAHGPASNEARRHIQRINVVQRVELVVLVLVVAAMTIKPTSDDGGTLLLFLAIVVAAVALGGWTLRQAGRSEPRPTG
ncbi:MAG TPA: DUF2269 family protein [Gaiellaceae bacterium]|nr:DUF2269 family protein [Gaiellaceae bacterium]